MADYGSCMTVHSVLHDCSLTHVYRHNHDVLAVQLCYLCVLLRHRQVSMASPPQNVASLYSLAQQKDVQD